MGGLSSIGKSIGKFINNATGATDAAAQNWAYQKQAMQNAHQWEVKDLEKAGLNPVYSANSQGASTGGVNAGMQPGGTGLINSAMTALTEGAKILQQDKKIDAETGNLNADTANKIEQNPFIAPMMQSNIAVNESKEYLNNSEAALNQKRQGLVLSEIAVNNAEKDLKVMMRGMNVRERQYIEKQIERIKMENNQLAKQYDVDSKDLEIQRKYLDSKPGTILRMMNMAFSDAKPAINTAAGIAGGYFTAKNAKDYINIQKERNFIDATKKQSYRENYYDKKGNLKQTKKREYY